MPTNVINSDALPVLQVSVLISNRLLIINARSFKHSKYSFGPCDYSHTGRNSRPSTCADRQHTTNFYHNSLNPTHFLCQMMNCSKIVGFVCTIIQRASYIDASKCEGAIKACLKPFGWTEFFHLVTVDRPRFCDPYHNSKSNNHQLFCSRLCFHHG